jgi:aspartyl-tRNA(Asn)/glutamyl-tRNA(Gln) amidotransferase subunit A
MKPSEYDGKYRMFSEFTLGDLKGETFSLSDDIVAKGFQATAGSKILEGHRPVYDSAVVTKMRGAGAALIGKTNMDEFGSGMFSMTCEKIPKNPFDPERSCGGPCGGAACAASLIEDHTAIATSAFGGITVPSSFCGVIGLTPTQGRVSRHGQIDIVSSMGPIGIIASNVKAVKKYLQAISGKDPRDPVSCSQPELIVGKKKLGTVAVPKGITDGVGENVRKAFDDSVEKLKGMSVDVEYTEMPHLKYAMASHYILASVEAALNLATYCGMRVGRQSGDMSMPFDDFFTSFRTKYFGPDVKKMIIAGTYMTLGKNRESLYLRALGVRQLVLDDHKNVLKDFDTILTPSVPFTAPKFAEAERTGYAEKYLTGRFSVPPVFCGLPSVSVPCGHSEGMPIGMQFISSHWNEDVLLSAAEMWEKAFPVRRPEVSL